MHLLIDVRGHSPSWVVPLLGLGCNLKADQAKRSQPVGDIPLQRLGSCPDFSYKLYEIRPFFPRLISVMLFYHSNRILKSDNYPTKSSLPMAEGWDDNATHQANVKSSCPCLPCTMIYGIWFQVMPSLILLNINLTYTKKNQQ